MKKEIVINRATAIVAFVYILFVLWGQYALFDTIFPSIPIGIGIIAISACLTKLLLHKLQVVKLQLSEAVEKKEIKKLAIVVFLTSLLIMIIGFYSRFPGIYFMDSVYQLNEAVTGVYDDWHPLLHTLLVFTVPYKIGGVWLIELLQIIAFSGALSYMICSLRYNRCPKWICISVYVYIMIHPDTVYMMLFPMKDSTFAILTMLLMTAYMNIVCSKGEWLKKNVHMAFGVVVWVVTTIVRHNAILFTAPLMLGLIYFGRRYIKRCMILLVAPIVLLTAIKIPVYRLFDMPPNEDRVTETMGICMVMMGNALVDSPELISDDTKAFLYGVQEEEVWEEYYRLGDFNPVKCYDGGADFDLIERTGRPKILEHTLNTIARCPDQTIKAFLAVTGMVWQLDGRWRWQGAQREYDDNYHGGVYDGTPGTDALEKYDAELPLADYIHDNHMMYIELVEDSALRYIFCFVGLADILLILVCFAKVRAEKNIRALLHILPVGVYNFGTAILLSSYDSRFFYYTFLCFFVSMFLLLRDDRENNNLEEMGEA